jgi:hypothetical protein
MIKTIVAFTFAMFSLYMAFVGTIGGGGILSITLSGIFWLFSIAFCYHLVAGDDNREISPCNFSITTWIPGREINKDNINVVIIK